MPSVVALPTNPSALTVGRAAELFLDSLANPNTIRGYATAVGKTAEKLGEDRPLATVADDDVGKALESLWAVRPWVPGTPRRAAVGSWLAWCRDRGDTPAVPEWCKRLASPDSETPVRSRLLLMAKSRNKKPENLRRYFKLSSEAIAEVTSLLAPGDSRR